MQAFSVIKTRSRFRAKASLIATLTDYVLAPG